MGTQSLHTYLGKQEIPKGPVRPFHRILPDKFRLVAIHVYWDRTIGRASAGSVNIFAMRPENIENKKKILLPRPRVWSFLLLGVLTAFSLSKPGTSQQPVVSAVPQTSQAANQNRDSTSACKRGMRYLKGPVVADQTDGSDGWTTCPENCSAPEDFWGYDPKDPSSFSRHQGDAGMCVAFTSSDYIAHRLGLFKRILKLPDFPRGLSAIDIEIQAFVEDNDQPDKNTIWNFLGPNAMEEGTWHNSTLENISMNFEIAKKVGACPEDAMPSQFGGRDFNQIRTVYESFESNLKDLKSRTEAGASLSRICKECKLIAPGLSDEQWEQVADTLKSVKNLGQDSFLVLKKIDDVACSGKRVKVPGIFLGPLPTSLDGMEDWLTERNSIVSMSVHGQQLDPEHIHPKPNDTNSGWDKHLVLVYGATIRNVNGTNVCFYKVKNSWGPNACMRDWGNKNPTKIQCDPSTGSYLISSDALKAMALGFQY